MQVALGINASQAAAGAAQWVGALSGINESIDQSIVKMVHWNAKAKEMRATFETTLASGKVVTTDYSQDLRQTIGSGKNTKANPNFGQTSFLGNKIVEDSIPAVETLGQTIEKLKNKLINIAGIQLFRNAVSSLTTALISGAKAAVEYEQKIAEIRTISQDMTMTTNEWADALQKLSNKFGVDQLDVAQAAYETLSNQVARGTQVFGFLNTALEFGKVTQAKAADSVNLLTSALNSFQMSATQADYVSAVLFKTIDLGRIKASDIANTFGRVAQMANSVGVSLEETSASLVVLTSAGIKPAEAMTLVTNLMQKLLRPSTEMKELLKSWGTPTAEAAIATFGYVGVLKKLEEASHGSTTELANLFHEIRAGRAATGLSLFGNLGETVEKLKTESADAYAVAKKITADSPARTIQQEFTAIRNFFVDDFGRTVVDVIASFSKNYISMSEIVTKGTKILISAALGWTALKVATVATSVATTVYNGVVAVTALRHLGLSGAIQMVTLNLRGLIATYGAAIIRVTAFAAAAAIAYLEYQRLGRLNAIGGGDLITRLQEEKLKSTIKAPTDAAQQQANDTKTNIDSIFDSVLRNLSRAYNESSNNLTRLKVQAVQLGESLRVAFDMGLNRLKQDINDISRSMGEMRSSIKSNEKFATEFGEKIQEAFFNQSMKYANEGQQIELLKRKLEELNGSIEQQANIAADPAMGWEKQREAIEKFKQEANQLIPLYIQLDDKLKAYAEQQARWAAQQNSYYNHTNDPVWLNANAMLERLRLNLEDAQGTVNNATQKINAGLTETLRLQQEILIKKKAELDTLEAAAKEYFDLQKKFGSGEIDKDPRFQTNNKYDPNKAQQAFRDASRTLTALAGANAMQFLEFWKQQQEVETNILRQGIEERKMLRINAMQTDVLAQKKALEKAAQDAADAQKNSATGLFDETSGSLQRLGQSLAKFKEIFDVFGTTGFERGWSKLVDPSATNQAVGAAIKGQQDVQKAIDLLNQLRTMDIGTPAGLDEFNAKLKELRSLSPDLQADLTRLISLIKGSGVDLSKITLGKGTAERPAITMKEVIDDYQKTLSLTNDLTDTVNTSREKAAELQQQMSDTFGSMMQGNEAFKGIIQGGTATEINLKTNFGNISTEIQGTINKANILADTIIQKLGSIGPINIPINLVPNNENFNLDLPPIDDQFYATGGRVNGPRGSDNIPAWLTKGEFVVNAEATKKFYSQLQAMNSSVRPGYYSQGGYVTTNVGDIHVSVTGTGSPERDVRAFAAHLRREIRRGTVKLS